MRIAALAAAAGLIFSTADAAEPARPRATVAAGVLEGAIPAGAPGAVFRGIPYAAPPVGSLRWRPPAAPAAWSGAREAIEFAPACAQLSRDGATGSEDCLYLNVWTPQWPMRAKAPVMVWLFGGANVTGSGSSPVFDGAALARRGVVVVTLNHRVGAMGFLAHPALSAESAHGSSGNYALLDQIAALQWVQANISRLGGDPAQVTLFGQSSGSYDLLLLMTSPLAKGLFDKAIAQSGQFLAYDGPMPKGRAEAIGEAIAAELKAPPGAATLPYLRALPAADVMALTGKHLPTQPGTDTGLLTNLDGWVLPDAPARVFAAGRQAAIPLLIGNNAREITPTLTLDELRAGIARQYGDMGPRALAAYGLTDGGPGAVDPLLGGAGAQWMTDIVQRCPANLEAEWHAATRQPTWRYQFERSIPGREAVGANHGAEVAFVFGNLDKVAPVRPAWTPADETASAQMQTYWTRFAKTGDPNGDGLPSWPAAAGGGYMAFTAQGPVGKTGLQAQPCAIYREWTLRRLGGN